MTPASRPPRRLVGFARRHWMIVLVGLLVATALGVRVGAGVVVGRQLAAQDAAARARGEAVTVAALARPHLEDAANAWKLIEKAGALDDGTTPASTYFTYPDYPPFGDQWTAAATASDRNNGAVFDLARRARGLERAQLVAAYRSPLILTSTSYTPSLGGARQVANTVGDGALFKHLAGDDVAAVERLLDVLHVGRVMHQDDPLLSQLMGLGITALAVNRTLVIAPGLRAEDPAVRQRIVTLIADLLDERHLSDGRRRSVAFERVAWDDFCRVRAGDAWAIRPVADRAVARANERLAIVAAAAAAPDAQTARRLLATVRQDDTAYDPPWGFLLGRPKPAARPPRYSRWFDHRDESLGRYLEQFFRSSAERRVAAVSLAARLFKADRGRFPAALAELVPAYLPAVPVDPFYADGRPIGYVVIPNGLPDGTGRPLVYYDAGARTDNAPDVEPMYGWQADSDPAVSGAARREIRQYRDVARWTPAVRRVDEEMRQEWERQFSQTAESIANAIAWAAIEEAEKAAAEAKAAGGPPSRPAGGVP